MQKKLICFVLIMLTGALICHSLSATNSKKPLWCIVGGTRGAGYALAQNLCNDNDVECTLFVRHDSAKKAASLMANTMTPPKIVQGDVTNELNSLIAAAHGASYLVIAQTFPYAIWEEKFHAMITNCIAAAHATGAAIVYYGRTQRYGIVENITELTQPQPNSRQGEVLNEAEKLLEKCHTPTILIHHSYPFGLHSGDGLLDKNFSGIPLNKSKGWYQSKQKFDWIGSSSIPLQITYLPDLAAFTRKLTTAMQTANGMEIRNLSINFAGLRVENINTIGKEYCKLAGAAYELNLYSRSKLMALSFASSEAKLALDSFDSFTHSIVLDDSFQKAFCPFELTPLEIALQQTYASYSSYASAY